MFSNPTPEVSMHERISEAKRVVDLRCAQMTMAALYRDAGDIDQIEWDCYAARYAAAVRELQALQYHVLNATQAMAETKRGATWVQR